MPHLVIDGPSCDSSTAIWHIPSPPTAHEHEQDHSGESRFVPPANVSKVCPYPHKCPVVHVVPLDASHGLKHSPCDNRSPHHEQSPIRTQLYCFDQSSCHELTLVINRQSAGCDHPHCFDKSICSVHNSSIRSSSNCKYDFEGKYFSFAHHNVNRLYHKLDEIRTYLHSFYPFNIYCCCETLLSNTISDQDILIQS